MHDQPRYQPQSESDFFSDGLSSRPLVEGTVARGQLRDDAHLYTGKLDDSFVDSFPFPVERATLERGRERYDIFCSPCHGLSGQGDGMVVRRGFRRSSSFHTDRLRGEPVGYFFDAITNGFGAMPEYRAQIPVRDRWAIIAYVRALQLSQYARYADIPQGSRGALPLGREELEYMQQEAEQP